MENLNGREYMYTPKDWYACKTYKGGTKMVKKNKKKTKNEIGRAHV